jgi:hypothetical protein
MRASPLARSKVLVALLLGAMIAAAVASADAGEPSAPPTTDQLFALETRALTGPKGVALTLRVTPAVTTDQVDALLKLQIKIFSASGKLAEVTNLKDVPAPGGMATIELGGLDRGQAIETLALIKPASAPETIVLRDATTVARGPDLSVAALRAPSQTLSVRPIDVVAEVAELNGDTGATATVELWLGETKLQSVETDVDAAGTASVRFGDVALSTPLPTTLVAKVVEADPEETDVTNNTREVVVDVTEHELNTGQLLVQSLGGFGAQLNQHVFADITAAPVASLPDLEAKVKALEPQLVRIFYNDAAETTYADRMASFVRTVELAQEAGAVINVTFQSAAAARLNPEPYMTRFAAILEDLVESRGITNLRWVTIQNEPNTAGLLITLEQYERLYRVLHDQLIARGLESQIGFMVGDLIESSGDRDQRVWFQYFAEHMTDIADAYSVHIYWDYWNIPRMEFRLKDVAAIFTSELPESARRPVYVTEFGVRGLRNLPGKPDAPGYWSDGTQITRTNIAAFQQLWFTVLAEQLGYTGVAKWDAYWGRYDNTAQSAWMIGPASEGWPLFPVYHAMRLLFQTTQRGWQVLRVDPWADDDWRVATPEHPEYADQAEKEIVAYAGGGALTLIGLDTHARGLNAVSPETVAYSIGGLPASTTFTLAVWNATGSGENAIGSTVTTSAAGVVRFEAPLHAAFALTTLTAS